MESLVFRLLRLEKIRSDAYTMHLERTSLHQLSEEVLGEFSTIYPHKKMTVTGKSELRVDRAWLIHRAANARPDSAGIGLAIARAVVQKHHGTISAENTATGLKIVICLPKIDGHESI